MAHPIRDGEFERWRHMRRVTTRCPTTMVRFGHTITALLELVWRITASSTLLHGCYPDCLKRRDTWTLRAFRNCSVASTGAGTERDRRFIRSHVRRRHGRPERHT